MYPRLLRDEGEQQDSLFDVKVSRRQINTLAALGIVFPVLPSPLELPAELTIPREEESEAIPDWLVHPKVYGSGAVGELHALAIWACRAACGHAQYQ